ncbi:hypothetical protein K7432_008773 [Basidiobolus ranarum]|uniref:Secreted protein n=1 Tax=Basidiobolus ranarum TaxID=34480 RepID=A0ABR2VY18_9FUNG
MYIKSGTILVVCVLITFVCLVAGSPIPQTSEASAHDSSRGTWKQQLERAVDYKPGDEYEENEFEDYADNISLLLPDGSEPAQNQDEDE